MPRFEDLRLVRGAGNYTDDISVPEQAYAVFVRTPHAHARVVSIDVSAARARPGVLAVLTGVHYIADDHIGMAHMPNPADAHDVKIPTFEPSARRWLWSWRTASRRRAMPRRRSRSNTRFCRR
jgi:carbon-monoxide dehydrogenase large subunit